MNLATAIEKADYWPTVGAYSGYQKSLGNANDGAGNWTLGLEASIPLYRPSAGAAIRKSLESTQTKVFTLRERQGTLTAEISESASQYMTSLAGLKVAEQKLEAARQRFMTTEQEYTAGLNSFLDWEQAQMQLIQSERGMLAAKHQTADNLAQVTFKSAGKLP